MTAPQPRRVALQEWKHLACGALGPLGRFGVGHGKAHGVADDNGLLRRFEAHARKRCQHTSAKLVATETRAGLFHLRCAALGTNMKIDTEGPALTGLRNQPIAAEELGETLLN